MKTLILVALCFAEFSLHANIVGVGPQNFNPTTDGLDFVTVQSSQTLNPGVVNLGIFINDAYNTLPYLDTSTQSRTKFNDRLVESDFGLGIGVFKGFELGLTLPFTLSQTVRDSDSLHGDFAQTGLTEIRPSAKYQFWGESRYGAALVGAVNFDQIQDDPYAGRGAGPTYDLELAGHTTVQKFVLGLNFGRRFRQPGTAIFNSVITPLRDQWIGSLAASYLVSKVDTKLIAEIYGAEPALPTSNGNELRNLTSLEALLGAKHDFSHQLAGHVGFGSGLARGVSTPDWRIYVGVNYAFGPLWNRAPVLERVVDKPPPVAPAEPEPTSPVVAKVYRMSNVPFEFNSDQLGPGADEALAPILEQIKEFPFTHLIVEGHTDSVGRAEYNLTLSQRRASTVRAYLLNKSHVPETKIESIGYGAEKPIADNGNYQGRQANRRVEFRIEH